MTIAFFVCLLKWKIKISKINASYSLSEKRSKCYNGPENSAVNKKQLFQQLCSRLYSQSEIHQHFQISNLTEG